MVARGAVAAERIAREGADPHYARRDPPSGCHPPYCVRGAPMPLAFSAHLA
jgi:hypothetical protein